jgi:hypothetical protein
MTKPIRPVNDGSPNALLWCDEEALRDWENGGLDDWDPCVELFDKWLHEHHYGRANGHRCRWSAPQLVELFGAERDKWQRLAACEFLEQLRPGGPWLLTAIVPDGATTTITAHTAEEVVNFIRKHNGTKNLYYSVNPLRESMTKKAAKIDIAAVEYTLADLDPADGETSENAKRRYLAQLETFQPRPSVAVDSGNGIQCLWQLEERVELGKPVWGKNKEGESALVFSPEDQAKVDDVEARTATIMKRLGAKAGTQNIDRILRLPGTTNLPNAKKKRAGRVACPTALLWFEDVTYPLDAFPSVADILEAYGNEPDGERDDSGSGYGFRFMQDRHGEGMSYEQAREAILADEEEAGEWANRTDERQLKRAYERSKPQPALAEKDEQREWPVLAPEALHGLAGEVVRTIEPHTESDPVALLIQFLVSFGSALGRGLYWQIEGTKHYTNLFAVLVGDTSDGRKGTSADRIRQVMNGVDDDWLRECVHSGLSSGEGLIWMIRDAIIKHNKEGEEEIVDPGVNDKRLLVDEREFSRALTVAKRDGNTLTDVIRNAWDGREHIASMTKNSKARVTDPHISISGHITPTELRSMLDTVSMVSGYVNRFLLVCVRRSKLLPFGGSLDGDTLNALRDKVYEVFTKAYLCEKEIPFDEEAKAFWGPKYGELSTSKPGLLGAICARAVPQTRRLAMLYAALDGCDQVKLVHLRAALALWKYCEDSARYIFGDSLGDALMDAVLTALRNSGGMSRTQLRDHFSRNQNSNKIDAALAALKAYGLVNSEMRSTKGRPVEFWAPV